MKNFIKPILASVCCASLLASGVARAHYVWLEPSDSGAALYFGEVEVQLREQSPGRLDRIKAPQAFVQAAAGDKPNAAAVSRTGKHLAIASAKTSTVLALEESMEVADLSKHGLGFAKSNYYARLGQPAGTNSAASPLALDVMQAADGAANTLTVRYRGQVLKGAKMVVIAPNTWTQEHDADAKGSVQINTPWRGQYVVHVLHIDRTAGEFSGKKYDNLRNHLTYTFTKVEGADAGPAQAPVHPME